MYVRKLKHSNGKTYIQVIDKTSGKYKVLKIFGSAIKDSSISELEREAEFWIKSHTGLIEGEIKVVIDKEKFESDAKWDGLKGYITNPKLNKNEILENYHHLCQIEKAFTIAKTDLKIRPIFHRKQKRIEVHICLTFIAYKVYKELERQLKEKKSELSPEKVIEILQSIYQIEVLTPKTKQIIRRTLLLTEEHKQSSELFDFGC